MTDDSDRYQFSQSEITAMRYAYRQLLAEHPERFPDRKAKEKLAKSVVESLERIKSTAMSLLSSAMAELTRLKRTAEAAA